MFGYITPDKPNMYMKDYAIYKAFYCGICKCTGKMYGQLMRMSTNYDITFISILLHNILEHDIELSNEGCILNPIKKKSIVCSNDLLKQVVWLNTLLANFKLTDDIQDDKSILKWFMRLALKRKVKKAKENMPEIYQLIQESRALQDQVEKENTISIDKAAHPFGNMLRDIFKIMCKDKYTNDVGDMMYHLGRFVYMADALDDFDKDKAKKKYNPLVLAYKDIKDRADLLCQKYNDIDFMLNSTYNRVKFHYQVMDFKLCEGVVTNVLWYGMSSTINRILSGEKYVNQSV